MTTPIRTREKTRMSPTTRLLASAAAVLAATVGFTASTQAAAADPVSPAVSAPEVFAGFFDNQPLNTGVVVRAMAVPTGTYTAFAKVIVINTGANSAEVTCRLSNSATFDLDESRAMVTPSIRSQTMALQVSFVNNFSSANFGISCQRSPNVTGIFLGFIKITAIRVADPSHLHIFQLS